MDEINNQTLPCQNHNELIFWLNISFLIFIIILFTFYLIMFLIYIITTWRKPKPKSNLITYWFDYGIIFFFAILFIVSYLIQQIQYYFLLPTCFYCSERFICSIVYGSGVVLMMLCSNNVILDILKGINLSWTMHEVSKFKPQELIKLTTKFTKIDVMKFINKRHHIKELIILGAIYVIVLVTYVIIYFGVFSKEKINAAIRMFFIIYRIFHFVLMLMIILVSYFLSKGKKKMLENNYHTKSLIIQRIYNSNIANLAYFSDFITYKAIIDVVGNTPILFFLAYERFDLVPMIIMFICYSLYLFFNAIILLFVDKEHKTEIDPMIKKIFCLKRLKFQFGAKELRNLFQDICFDYSDDEVQALKDHYVNTESRNTSVFIQSNERTTELSDFRIIPNNRPHNEGVNYFIIFKLLYLFFKKNEKIYTETQQQMEEDGNAFKLVSNPKEREQTLKSGVENLINRISRISRISKLKEQSLTTSLKLNLDSLMDSLEDKEYMKAFKQSSVYQENGIITQFRIESLFNSLLYELFPFYQLTIKDILTSLDPGYNTKLFEIFMHNVQKDKNYNDFYTYDLFLFYEIYDHLFLAYDKLKDFFMKYHAYLMNVVKNLNYTHIPIIVGIYHVNYADFNKIIILYRNPLSFSSFVKFNHWIRYTLTEAPEECSVSQKYNDVIDVNEIEVKNNIRLSIDEFEEITRNLVNDSNFILGLPFKSYPKIGLFVGNEIYSGMKNQINESDGEIIIPNKQLQQQPSQWHNQIHNNVNNSSRNEYRDSKLFVSFSGDDFIDGNSVIMKYKQKDYGSEISSLFEREYEIKGNEGGFMVKIFYMSLFRDNCALNVNEKNSKSMLETKSYGE